MTTRDNISRRKMCLPAVTSQNHTAKSKRTIRARLYAVPATQLCSTGNTEHPCWMRNSPALASRLIPAIPKRRNLLLGGIGSICFGSAGMTVIPSRLSSLSAFLLWALLPPSTFRASLDSRCPDILLDCSTLYQMRNPDFSRAEQGAEKVGALAPASLKQAPSGAKAQVLC